MSSSPPASLFGATTGDRRMMQEILELLATDSPTNNQDSTAASTTGSSRSNNDSSSSQIRNFGPVDYTDSSSVTGLSGSFAGDSVQDIEGLGAIGFSNVGSLEQAAVGPAPPAPLQLGQPCTNTSPQLTDGSAFAAPVASLDGVAQVPLPRCPTTSAASAGTSHVLPAGQRLHVMNQAEFDELRRKLRAKTSSCRYRKRKKVCSLEKEETRKKKKKIQELKAELARLQDIERQSKHYEQRSLEDLEEELAKHKQEVADLSVKIGEAAQEELDWIRAMSSQLRK